MAESAPVRLKTSAGMPSAEILVLDSNFQFVHRAVGSLDVALAPGVYTVQYRAGSAAEDVAVALRPGAGEVELAAPKLQMQSPAPLAGNRAGALYGELAQTASAEVHARLGRGAELFVFVRLATADNTQAAGTLNRLHDVAILDAHARRIAHLSDGPKRALDDHAAGYNLELDPGIYLLRVEAPERGSFEQSIVLCEGWQTQVFASSRRYGAEANVIGANLPEAAIFMARRGRGFAPMDANVAWTESARQALAQGTGLAPEQHLRNAMAQAREIRARAAAEQWDELFKVKFANPMLGIYGAHLLLQARERNWVLLREVIETLERLLGAHPDVTALKLLPELADMGVGESESYAVPPMLRSSWSIIIAATAGRPQLVPPGSYSERVADRTWDTGAWLVWRSALAEGETLEPSAGARYEPPAAKAAEFEPAAAIVQRYVAQRLAAGEFGAMVKEIMADTRFSDSERAVLLYFAGTAGHAERLLAAIRANSGWINRGLAFIHEKLASTGLVQRAREVIESELGWRAQLRAERLVQSLGMPAASLERTMAALAHKVSATEAKALAARAVAAPEERR
ncbi:MAG: hypothetical protein IT531_03815 [Burkholderiales bacterium]|nr:hypothetical protein [Burkholderiales bacterium]